MAIFGTQAQDPNFSREIIARFAQKHHLTQDQVKTCLIEQAHTQPDFANHYNLKTCYQHFQEIGVIGDAIDTDGII